MTPWKPAVRIGFLLAVAALALALSLVWPRPAAARAVEDPVLSLRQASEPPELKLDFEEAAVVAAGLTPGGDAVFWSVGREPLGYHQRVVESHGLAVVDALGEARFEPREGTVLPKSVWAVADLATGAFAVGAPPGFRLRRVPFPGSGFEVGDPGLVNRLRHDLESLVALVVRPRVGAWRVKTWDASTKDRDGEDDGRVAMSLEDLEPLEAAGPDPPERFTRDDVIVVVDPVSLRFYATRLLEPPVPGKEEAR